MNKAIKFNKDAFNSAKNNNCAYIVENGWIVRVYRDNHKERIKYLGVKKLNRRKWMKLM